MFTIFLPGESVKCRFYGGDSFKNQGFSPALDCANRALATGKLFLKARAPRRAGELVNRLVVHANDGLREVAPEVIRRGVLAELFGKSFRRCRAGEHFFGAEMFAENRVHTAPFNLSRVRRISACAIGIL